MDVKVELRWVRTPRQDRSWKTLERILDATEALLIARGLDSVSVAEIARRADSSVGAIYARFRDKNGLLHCLHERFCEEAMATANAALDPVCWEKASAREILSALIAFLIEIYQGRGGLFRAFLLCGCTDPHFQQRARGLREHFLAKLKALLLARQPEMGHPDPALAITFGMEMVMGMLRNRFVLGEGLPEDGQKPRTGLAEELIRAYGAYLGLSATDGMQQFNGRSRREASG